MELEIKAASAGKIHFLVAAGTPVSSQQPIAQVGCGVSGSAQAPGPGPMAAPPLRPPVAPVPAAPAPRPMPAPIAAPAAAPAAAARSGGSVIPAPVAGTLLRYSVSEGAVVKAGDTVLVLESMKMELEIKSMFAGKIHFLVATGTPVASQQPVAEIN